MLKNIIATLLTGIYNFVGNYGLSIILFTLFIRLILLPFAIQSKKNMVMTQKLQPLVNQLQKKYKNDPQTLQKKQMELYKEHNHNPLSGCLPLLIQMPIIFTLFSVLRDAASYVPQSAIDQSFLWLPNMVDPDTMSNIINIAGADRIPGLLPIVAAAFTFITFKMTQTQTAALQTSPDGPKAPNMNFMAYIFPVVILMSGTTYSAGLILYWAVSTILQFVQDRTLNAYFNPKEDKVA